MNLLPGSALGAHASLQARSLAGAGRSMLGVRPEHIGSRSTGVPAQRRSVEYLGADSLVDCRIGGAAARRARGRPAALAPASTVSTRLGRRRDALFRCDDRADASTSAQRRSHRPIANEEDEAMTETRFLKRSAAAGAARSSPRRRSRRRRSRSRSTTRSRSAARSRRSSTAIAADFEKENPGIKVKPIYAGTYQETIVKALTALKSGKPPVTSVLLSTDMFTLIDEDAIVPFDDFVKTRRRQGVAEELLPGVHGEQPDRRQDLGHSVPALDDRALLEQGAFKEAGLDPEQAARRPGRRWPTTRRSSPSATRAATSRSGACRFRRPASRTGCSRA